MSSSEPPRTPRPPLRRIASNYLCTPHGLLAHPLVETDAAGRIVSVTRCTDPDRLAATEYHAGILLPAFVDACDDHFADERADGHASEYADGHAPEYADGQANKSTGPRQEMPTDNDPVTDGHAPEYADGQAPEYADGHALGPAAEPFFNSLAEPSADLPAGSDRLDQQAQPTQSSNDRRPSARLPIQRLRLSEFPIANQELLIANPEFPAASPKFQIANSKFPIANQEPQIADPEPPAANPELPAANPEPQVTNPEPPIANPEPQIANPEPPIANPEPPIANPELPIADPELPAANSEFQVGALLAAIRPDRRTMIVVDRPLAQPEIDCIATRSGAPVWWCLSFRLGERHFLRAADLLHRSGQLLCTGDGTPDRPDRLALLARLQRLSDVPLHRLLAWSTSCAAAAAGLPAGEVRAGLRCGVNQLSGIDYEHLRLTERSRIRRIV